MRKFALAAIFAATAATPVLAQQAPFTGLRVEGLAGYDVLRDGSDGESDGRDGLTYGGQVGYDLPVGGVILGVEGEIGDATTKARANDVAVVGDRLSIGAGRDLYVGGRVGIPVSPRALAYAKAGYTNARVNARYTSGNTTVRDSSDLDGFRVGAGLEYALNGSTYVKGEYRYSNYSGIDGFDTDIDRHQVLAGLGVRF